MSNKYYLDILNKLVGGKIVSAITDKSDEYFGLEIKLMNGKTNLLWFLQDDEGNGPGWIGIDEI